MLVTLGVVHRVLVVTMRPVVVPVPMRRVAPMVMALALSPGLAVVSSGGVGAALGIERSLDRRDLGAEPLQHVFDHVVPSDADRVRQDLSGQVPIADMPSEAHEIAGSSASDFHQRLGGRDDLDETPILQQQRVAAPQHDGLREIQKERDALNAGHHGTPPVPIIEVQHHRVGSRLSPTTCRADACGSDHDGIFLAVLTCMPQDSTCSGLMISSLRSAR